MDNFDLTKKVKELRTRRGLSQEQLADLTLLSLRTIQRIENGENVPRGDTLKRLAVALNVSPDEIIDWRVQEDRNVLFMLNFSQLGLLAFPLLGIIIPLAIWIIKKDKVKDVDEVGKSILNFQLSHRLPLRRNTPSFRPRPSYPLWAIIESHASTFYYYSDFFPQDILDNLSDKFVAIMS